MGAVVIKKGTVHQGLLHSFAQNGGEIGLGDGFALCFVPQGNFVMIQLLHYGIGISVATKSWKEPKKKKVTKKLEIDTIVAEKKAW